MRLPVGSSYPYVHKVDVGRPGLCQPCRPSIPKFRLLGQTKNAEYIAALMIEDIYSLGCTRVILVTSDTCSTMRKAWTIVASRVLSSPSIGAVRVCSHETGLWTLPKMSLWLFMVGPKWKLRA